MKKASRLATIGQGGKKGAKRPPAQAEGENAWGGRRHGLGEGGGNCRLTVTLTRCDMEILEGLRGSVTDGDVTVGDQKNGRAKTGTQIGTDGLRMDGKPSHAAIIRRALRLLWLMEGG